MYIEKEYLLNKIDEYCSISNIELTFDEKYKLSSCVSKILDNNRVITSDEHLELIEHNITLESYETIEFNDEIMCIEEVGYEELYDIEVDGNHLFYANRILTHNSAVNNLESDNAAVSDSIGTVQTADFICFLLQTEEMKERKEVIFKITKNRFNGRTDYFTMSIDYEKMRFTDVIEMTSTDQIAKTEEIINTELEKERIAASEVIKESWDFTTTGTSTDN